MASYCVGGEAVGASVAAQLLGGVQGCVGAGGGGL